MVPIMTSSARTPRSTGKWVNSIMNAGDSVKKLGVLLFVTLLVYAPAYSATVKLDSFLLQNGAMIQRERPLQLWGSASPGTRLTATIASHVIDSTAGEDGRFLLVIPAMPATSESLTLTISAGENDVLAFSDLLVGDVWLCSGQSNMVFDLARSHGGENLITSEDRTFRLFQIAPTGSGTPQTVVEGTWRIVDPHTGAEFSGVAMGFGKHLREETDIPIGLIQAAFGGTPIESWVSPWLHQAHPDMEYSRREVGVLLEEYPDLYTNFDEDHITAMKEFELAREEWRERMRAGGDRRVDRRPGQPTFQSGGKHIPTVLYNAMIHPFTHWPIAGVIWYQGESNSNYHRQHYRNTMALLIEDWRERWHHPEMPFLMVQLANFRDIQTTAGERSHWAEIRWAKFEVARNVAGSFVATAIDLGDPDDLHPRDKIPVGERLALLVRRHVLGETDLISNGPVISTATVSNTSVMLYFEDVGEGLRTIDPEEDLRGFEGECHQGQFHFLDAEIVGMNQVRLLPPPGTDLISIRYAWADNPIGNLTNDTGIPAYPFRINVPPGNPE